MLLSAACMIVSAEDYKTYEDAAKASHKTLKETIEAQKGQVSIDKKIKNIIGKTDNKNKKYTYVMVLPDMLEKADTTFNKKHKPTKIEQTWVLEGNLKIKDAKTNDMSKYVTKGYVVMRKDSVENKKVKGSKQKAPKTYSYVYKIEKKALLDYTKIVKVSYFESEAQEKAKKLVDAYYKQHKEFAKINVGKVEPCELGYKVTTSRTFYKDEQQYTGNEGTVIFTVQKDAEQLDGFKLLEQTEENLTEFNTPAPVEPTQEEPEIEDPKATNKIANIEDLAQISINSFNLNSVELSDENKEQLDQVAQFLLSNNEVEIEFLGHSCELGDEETNYNFGLMRAKEAKQYLISKGVEQNRIHVYSYGEKKPLVPNTTAENRAQNRRIEIKVIK